MSFFTGLKYPRVAEVAVEPLYVFNQRSKCISPVAQWRYEMGRETTVSHFISFPHPASPISRAVDLFSLVAELSLFTSASLVLQTT